MDKILLVGNPNVGKSVMFSRLTGAKVMVSNYPGTTIEFTQGKMKVGNQTPVVIDIPGTYTLEPSSRAEEVAVQMLREGGVVINIIDATHLERNLNLTLQLLEKNLPVIVALNMWDDTKHQGIHIDVQKLEKLLGVPVVPTCGLSGEGVKELVERLPEAKTSSLRVSSDSKRWETIGKIVEEVQKLTPRHHTLLEKVEDLSIKPVSGIIVAFGVMACAFWSIRLIAEGLIRYVFEPLFEYSWFPLMTMLSNALGEGMFLHTIFIGTLFDGRIDFGQSFGLLTTGLFVPFAMVLPYLVSFYLMLGILEDFGYLPRLAVLLDNFMHHFGLHGYASIPMMLGMGCKVPGLLATRILEGRREKFIAAAIISVSVPCMAQTAMIVGLLGERGAQYVALVFFVLFILAVSKGLILNKTLKGASPEILIEIPPYRLPQLKAVLNKLWLRLFGFFREAIPLIFLGVLFINMLYALGAIDFLARILSPVITGLWGLPREIVSVLVVGFLRKDIAVGMLAPFNLTTKQLVIASTVLAIYFPCIAAFIVLLRELGVKDVLKILLLVIFVATAVGAILNVIL